MVKKTFSFEIVTFLSILVLVVLVPVCSAHVPKKSEGNDSLQTAFNVDDPTKSWSIYAKIHEPGEARYYQLELEKNQILRATLFVPNKSSFVPDLIITGPNLESSGILPNNIEIPKNYDYLVLDGNLEDPEYEPFTPASYYYLADFEKKVEETGKYYVIVTEPDDEGNYGLAIGKEERYGLIEWIRIPFDVINIRQWEGQPLFYVFLPLILTIILGFLVLMGFKGSKFKGDYTVLGWLVISSGLLFFGSGVMKFVEMGIASSKVGLNPIIFVTVIFASLPIVLGSFTIRKGMELNKDIHPKDRFKLLAYGIIALFIWAGFILGSIIIVLASILPSKISKS